MSFDSYHPALNALFFAFVLWCTWTWTHPVFTAISWLAACCYILRLRKGRGLLVVLVSVVLAALWGLWFATHTHFGVTNLGRTIIGNSITAESIACGMAEGSRLACCLVWLACLVTVFTADKVVFLLGRVSPKLALLVAVAMRAAPMVGAQYRRVGASRLGIGRGPGQGGLTQRFKSLVCRLSTLVTWSMERFVQMSDSMRSRGSLLKKRTAYSLYRFDNRDRALVIWMSLLAALCLAAFMLDQTYMLFDPMIVWVKVTPMSYVFFAAFALWTFLPLALDAFGELSFALSRRVTDASEGTEG